MGRMHFQSPNDSWYTLVAGIMGPFLASTKGYKFNLVIQDTVTKWVKVNPLRSAASMEIKEKFKELVFFRYGSSTYILTDNRSQYPQKVSQDWKVKHVLTSPYPPQANLTKRSNRVQKMMIWQFINASKTWNHSIYPLLYSPQLVTVPVGIE